MKKKKFISREDFDALNSLLGKEIILRTALDKIIEERKCQTNYIYEKYKLDKTRQYSFNEKTREIRLKKICPKSVS